MSIVVVGSINQDLIVAVTRLPGPGETVVGTSTRAEPGGKGANQAAAAARLGGRVRMLGRVGDDAAGSELIGRLCDAGVATGLVLVSDSAPTGAATVVVDQNGENLIVVAPGANAEVSAADVSVDAVRAADIVLLQLEIPMATVAAAVAAATGAVVLNTAPSAPLPAAVLGRVDVLVANEPELRALAGGENLNGDDLVALARSVSARDVIVTLGARGELVVPAAGEPSLLALPAVEAVDTTGAGDCFCGALCVALDRGVGLIEAARYATAAAALSTTGPGARGALPTDADVRALLG